MHILLTGSTGFIGSNLLKFLLQKDFIVHALRRSEQRQPKVMLPFEPHWVDKSLEDLSEDDFTGIDILVHLAAHSANYPYDDLHGCLYYNLILPLRVFELANRCGVKKYLVTGSSFEYGLSGNNYDYIPAYAPLEPTQTYPASKAAASIAFMQWATQKNVSLSLCRIFQAYGPGEQSNRLWPSLVEAATNGSNFELTSGDQIRDFIYIDDVVKILYKECVTLYQQPLETLAIVNIGTGKPQQLYDFCKKIWTHYCAKGVIIRGAKPNRPGEILRLVPCLKVYYPGNAEFSKISP